MLWVRVQRELERLLACSVDLATPGTIRPEHRDRFFGEAVRCLPMPYVNHG